MQRPFSPFSPFGPISHFASSVLLVFFAALVAFMLPTQAAQAATTGSGTAATQQRPVSDFDSIAISAGVKLLVRQSGREALEVRADDNLLPLLETVVEPRGDARVLHIRWKRGESIRTRSPASVTVDVIKLRQLTSSGSSDIVVEPLQTPALSLSLAGSGSAVLNRLDTGDLAVGISGSGDVRGSGKAARAKLTISGSGDIKLGELVSDEVSVRIAGSGEAAVHAEKTLDVSIAGSGDVVYSGAAQVKTSVAGSGSVKKR